MSNRLITAPTALPVTLEEMKTHLNEISSSQDALITAQIRAAARTWQSATQHALMLQTREETLDGFNSGSLIKLEYPRVASIDSVIYIDANGVEQTLSLASYALDSGSDNAPGWLAIGAGLDWPSTYNAINTVAVRYTCGYADAADVPEDITQWIKLVVGHWYANREAVNVGNISSKLDYVDVLLDGYRVY